MPSQIKGINRIIDANINRLKEGLRVCEEITRFILNSHNLTTEFKKIRHRINAKVKYLANLPELLKERKSLKDVGKKIYINELKRQDSQDIFLASMQRVKESLRVLEEFAKLKNIDIAREFKKIRYQIYELEKKTIKRLLSLYHHR